MSRGKLDASSTCKSFLDSGLIGSTSSGRCRRRRLEKTCRGRRIHTKEIRDSGFWRRKVHLDWSFGWGCNLAVVIILKLRCHYRLDSVHFGFWILKYHLDCSYWWICDLAVLDGWVIQVCKWVHSGWKFGHTPSRVICFLLIIIIIRKLRSSYRLDGVLDGLFDWLEHA